jgi:hypothetical protein
VKKFVYGVFYLILFVCAAFSSDVDVTQGSVRLRLYENSGTFSAYVINANGKQYALFSEYEQASATFFSLKAGNNVFRLQRGNGISVKAGQTDNGAKLIYTITRGNKAVAEVALVFTFVQTIPGFPIDALCLDIVTTNISDAEKTFTLKGLFDTVIGEIEGPVFSTALDPAIKSETALASIVSHRWIRVSNYFASLRILLAHYGITVPASIVIANRQTLSSDTWAGNTVEGRSFSSYASFNDSAIEIRWNPVSLKSGESQTTRLYFSVSADIAPPASALSTPTNSSLDAFFSSYGISPEQIAAADVDSAYIEDLLARIQQVVSQGENADRAEIHALNAELDAVIDRLRR